MFNKPTVTSPLFAVTLLSVTLLHRCFIVDSFVPSPHAIRTVKPISDNIITQCFASSSRNDINDLVDGNDVQKSAAVSSAHSNRRRFLSTASTAFAMNGAVVMIANAAGELPDQFNVDNYLKSGMVMNPMGVSGQAGKSKPVTGILLREGSEVSRDSRTGDVLAEILVQGQSSTTVPVLASFVAPWPLASGTVFDVECRNPSTGDGAFLAVTSPVKSNAIQDIPDTFFVEQLIGPTGRFSSYGTPTDVKIRSSTTNGNYRIIDMSFSTLSQSTQTELPRRARIVATIPEGSRQAVMVVGSASLSRWNKSSKETILAVTDSFRAIPAPTSSLRLRAKERRS